MELLHELESQADEFIVERMRWTIADALAQYKPICEECNVAMVRHHCYERTLITNYGEMSWTRPRVSLRRLRRNDRRHGCHRQG